VNRRAFLSVLGGGLLAAPLPAGCQHAGMGARPIDVDSAALPPALPDPVNNLMSGSNPIPENLGGATINVGSGGEALYTALGLPTGKTGPTPCLNADGSHKGNTYVCPPGAVYSWMRLPATTGAGWTCIRSGSPTLPPFGTRIMGTGPEPNRSDASKLFKVATAGPHQPDQGACFTIPPGSNGWRIVGAEMGPLDLAHGPGGYGLLHIGGSRVCVERCWVHGYTENINVIRGIYVTSELARVFAEDIQIWDSWVGEIKHDDADNQAIYLGLNRRAHVENCHIESSCENFMVGSQGWGQYGEHITLKRSHIYKPPKWFQFLMDGVTRNPIWDGGGPNRLWSMKNLLETKVARLLLVEGCVFENMWKGPAFVHNTQDLSLTDVTWQHNIFINCLGGWSIGIQMATWNERVKIYNNAWINMPGMAGWHTWTAKDMWVEHNTFAGMIRYTVPDGRPEMLGWVGGPNFNRYTFKHNIIGFRGGGPAFFDSGIPGANINVILPDRAWAENAIYSTATAPEPSFTPYVSVAAAGINTDGTLTANSPLRRGNVGYFGTDGKDIGVDFVALAAAMGRPDTVDARGPKGR